MYLIVQVENIVSLLSRVMGFSGKFQSSLGRCGSFAPSFQSMLLHILFDALVNLPWLA